MLRVRQYRVRRRPPLVPGCEGKIEICQASRENPYRPNEFETVSINIRESSLAHMHARKQIDEAQFRAGDWIRRKFESMRIGSGAVDPSNEPVDCSGRADPVPDRVFEAGKDMAAIRLHLGAVAWPVVALICCEGHTLAQAALRLYGSPSERERLFVGRLLRLSLDEAAIYLGYAGKNRK